MRAAVQRLADEGGGERAKEWDETGPMLREPQEGGVQREHV